MSLGHGSSIVRDGLVLHLDAANKKSYPGSGNTWSDLSGQGNDGTLVNGVGFSADNKGSLTFDGSNDFVDVETSLSKLNLSNNSNISYDFFIFPEDQQGYILWSATGTQSSRTSQQYAILWDNSNRLNVSGGSNGSEQTGSLLTNKWYHVVMTLDRNNNLSLYLNAELVLSFSPGSVNSSDQIRIGNRNGGVQYKGKISTVKGYNSILSATEIQQNFEATRGRYGI